jgi:hypothetical protein
MEPDDAAAVPTCMQAPVLIGTVADVLHGISKPGVELAIWQRVVDLPWSAWLEALPAHALPACRLEVKPSKALACLHATCDANGTPGGPVRDAFLADVIGLVAHFAAITQTDTVGLRLEVVEGNACRRWHRDCVPMRLICTYRGPGTLWMPPPLGPWALTHADDDLAQQSHALAAGDVALFKGCGWAGQTLDKGIVHRSPRIEGTGQTRLVLVLDPLRPSDPGR